MVFIRFQIGARFDSSGHESTLEPAAGKAPNARVEAVETEEQMRRLGLMAIAVLLVAPACDREKSSWKRVQLESLQEAERQKLDRAQAAQMDLGKTLKGELTSAVKETSFAGAVDFCHERAPAIAKEVASEHGVAIGRTSHRLRNVDNTPPAWAEDAVERKEAREYIFRGPDDQLGYLKPIKLGGLCTNCHGPKDELAPGVAEQLQRTYPQDEATGFAEGDLRGWFWVEVPGA
jgi:hypothetical protein